MASLIVIVTVALECAVTDTDDVPGGIAKNSYAVSVAELVDEDVLNVSVTLVATAECDTTSDPSVALIVADDEFAHVTVGHATVVPRLITLIVPLPVLVNVDSDEKYLYGSSAIRFTCVIAAYPFSFTPAAVDFSVTKRGIATGRTSMYKL